MQYDFDGFKSRFMNSDLVHQRKCLNLEALQGYMKRLIYCLR